MQVFDKISEIMFGDHELSTRKQRLVSLIFMILAIGLAWKPQEQTSLVLFIWKRSKTGQGFAPDLLTALIGLLIVLPLYVRNILKWRGTSVYSILSFTVNLTLCATFCKIILGGQGFVFSSLTVSLGIALLLAWVGMRPVAGIAWIAIFIMGIVQLQITNQTLGVYGFLFVLFGFLGVVLHAELKPSELYHQLKYEFRGSVEKASSAAAVTEIPVSPNPLP